jgi:hypothetical protein
VGEAIKAVPTSARGKRAQALLFVGCFIVGTGDEKVVQCSERDEEERSTSFGNVAQRDDHIGA